jgi:hypothetical protein
MKVPGRVGRRFLTSTAATFAVVGVLVKAVSGGSSPAWDPKPSCTIDLRTLGYSPRVLKSTLSDREFFAKFDPSKDPSIFESYFPETAFIDDRTVVVSWVRPLYADSGDGQDPRVVPTGLQLHVSLVDVATSRTVASRDFSTVFRRWFNRYYDSQSTVTPLRDGKFLVHASNRLMMFNREFQPLCERELPVSDRMENSGGFAVFPGGATKGWAEMWALFVAPAGRTLLLQHQLGTQYILEWLNPEDLTTTNRQDSPNVLMAISDGLVTYRWFRSIKALRRGGSPYEVCSRGPACEGGVPWVFLDKAQLLVPRQRSFLIYSQAGEILWSRKGKVKGNGILYVASSPDGNRFVIPISAERGTTFGEGELKRGDNFLVYDAAQRSLVFQAHVAGVGAPALSPNGSKLALLVGTEMAIYDLPASK